MSEKSEVIGLFNFQAQSVDHLFLFADIYPQTVHITGHPQTTRVHKAT